MAKSKKHYGPMQAKYFQLLDDVMQQQGSKGHLMLFSAQTGSGKSYAVDQFLIKRAVAKPQTKAFYVTNQIKNLGITQLERFWNQMAPPEMGSFWQNVGVLKGLPDLCETLLYQPIPEFFISESLSQKLKDLDNAFNVFETLNKAGLDTRNAHQNLAKFEAEIRLSFIRQIANVAHVKGVKLPLGGETQQVLQQYVKQHPSADFEWLHQIYPTFDLDAKRLYIMTTKKFNLSYTPFFALKGQVFASCDLLQEALVVMDEFDTSQATIQETIIDNALGAPIDILNLFNTIEPALHMKTKLSPMMNQIIAQSDEYDRLKRRAKMLRERYYLNLVHKTTDGQHDTGFVFHLPRQTLVSGKVRWHAHLDRPNKTVHITRDQADDLHFEAMLHHLGEFELRFARFIQQCAETYRSQYDQDHGVGLTIEEGCKTIYNLLGFQENQANTLFNFGMNAPLRVHSSTHTSRDQNSGISIYALEDAPKHAERTVVQARFIKNTPEQFLLTILKKANIIGISATAEVPTVLHHYDLKYLQEQLGAHLMHGRDYLPQSALAAFDLHDRYRTHGVQFEVAQTKVAEDLKTMLKQWLPQNARDLFSDQQVVDLQQDLTRQVVAAAVSHGRDHDKFQRYVQQRYLNLFASFIAFLTRPHLVTFLGLQNLLPKHNRAEMDSELINAIFDHFKAALHVDEAQLVIIQPGVKTIKKQLEVALAQVEAGKRVYLLSAYQTIGVGQNLQHTLCPFDHPHVVNIVGKDADDSDPRQNSVDLSGIYLGEVTHVIGQNEPLKLDKNGLKSVIQLDRLMDAGEIDGSQYQAGLNALVRGRQMEGFEEVASFVGSHTQIIAQAVGRMNRAFNKCKQPFIMINAKEAQRLDQMDLSLGSFSVEMQELFFCDQQPRPNVHTLIAKNLRDTAVVDAQAQVNLLIDQNATAETIQAYQELRLSLLRWPTATDEELLSGDVGQLNSRWHFDQPLAAYSVRKIRDGVYDYQAGIDQSMQISAAAARLDVLMKYPGMQARFEGWGFATQWHPAQNLLNPYQFNLYCGILGEVTGQAILEEHFKGHLRPLTDVYTGDVHELFDFAWENGVVVDIKHWAGPRNVDGNHQRQHVREKLAILEQLSAKPVRALIVNVICESPAQLRPYDDGKILELSGLIDRNGQFMLSDAQVRELSGWLYE